MRSVLAISSCNSASREVCGLTVDSRTSAIGAEYGLEPGGGLAPCSKL
jgi:hypothetical protein